MHPYLDKKEIDQVIESIKEKKSIWKLQ
jgi:hypothetical protein